MLSEQQWLSILDSLSEPALIVSAVFVAAMVVAHILRKVLFAVVAHVLCRYSERLAKSDAAVILERLPLAGFLGIFFSILLAATPFLPIADATAEIYGRVTVITFIAFLGATLLGLMHGWADIAVRRQRIDVADNLEARKYLTRMRILRRIGAGLIGVITVAAMLMAIPAVRNYGVSLFASAGVIGIVVGFAARPVLSNLLAGLQIALTQPIRIDDVVIVEGEWGWIEEITATYVVVRIWDWRRLIVPLSYFIENPFQNWTRESASIIGSVFWEVDYTVPVAKVRDKLRELLKDHPLWDKDVANLQVTDSKERTVTLRALMSAKTSPEAWDLRCDIREKMLTWLQADYPDALPRIRAEVGREQPSPRP